MNEIQKKRIEEAANDRYTDNTFAYKGSEIMSKKTIEKKIDPAEEGIGMTGDTMRNGKASPHAMLNGKELYRRIFIRLRTPQEVLTCSPIQDGEDFARRASIIENWFNSVIRKGNYLLTFQAVQLTDEEADEIEKEATL